MWDDSYILRQSAKRDFRRLAIALILQEIVLICTAYGIQNILAGFWMARDPGLTSTDIYDLLLATGLDMIAASLAGLLVVLLMLGKRLRRSVPGEHMGLRQFVLALIGISGLQLLSTLVTVPLENLVNSLGYSLEQAAEISTSASSTVSMLLYSVIIAPLVEEVAFRGAVQRWLEPWGRGFALVTSAALFGLMHNNLVQLPVAFACGLLFGYIAQRFSLRASIAAHALNNLSVELAGLIPDEWGLVWSLYSLAMLLSAAYLIYWCLTRREDLARWFRKEAYAPPSFQWFLTSVPVVLLLLIYGVRTLQSALPA